MNNRSRVHGTKFTKEHISPPQTSKKEYKYMKKEGNYVVLDKDHFLASAPVDIVMAWRKKNRRRKKINSLISIRPADQTDKVKILSVIGSYGLKWDRKSAKVYYDDYFSSSASLKGDTVYVAVLNDKIIGVTGYFIDRYETGNYWLGWFYIHKQYARTGYGRQLLNFIIGKLRKKRTKRLFVNTSSYPFYRGALNFYLKNGFRIEAIIKDYYWNGEDQIILSRQL